jgi:hypothetical protein
MGLQTSVYTLFSRERGNVYWWSFHSNFMPCLNPKIPKLQRHWKFKVFQAFDEWNNLYTLHFTPQIHVIWLELPVGTKTMDEHQCRATFSSCLITNIVAMPIPCSAYQTSQLRILYEPLLSFQSPTTLGHWHPSALKFCRDDESKCFWLICKLKNNNPGITIQKGS